MSLGRRHLLGLSLAAVTGASATGLAGCATDPAGDGQGGRLDSSACLPRSGLVARTAIGSRPLVYEISRRRSRFWFDPDFHDQLGRWLTRFFADAEIREPSEIWTYGSWIDGEPDCDSWHNAGRAFDLSRLRRSGRDVVSCRYDLWQTASDLDQRRRRYWALAASLHHDFAYVLTYLYNAQHHNHIHVDNGRSGSGLSTFSTRSPAQVQAVQAMINYLWDLSVDITGRWDAATRRASRTVLDRIGVAADLDASVEAWRTFLRSGAARFSR